MAEITSILPYLAAKNPERQPEVKVHHVELHVDLSALNFGQLREMLYDLADGLPCDCEPPSAA